MLLPKQELFGRAARVVVNTTEVTGLDVAFTVKKSLKPEPNTCDLKIWGLSQATRDLLSSPKKAFVRIDAGYGDNLSQIYKGETRSAYHTREGAEWITHLESGDGEKEIQKNRLSVPLGPKTPVNVALKAIAEKLGVGFGNVSQVAAKLAATGKAIYPSATTLHGNVAQILTDFCRSADLEWSIQDGNIQILDLGSALTKQPLLLNSDTGLIGSPSIGSDGKVTATLLMIAGVVPGIRLQFDSLQLKGLYRLTNCEYSGDLKGQEWYIKVTCDQPKN